MQKTKFQITKTKGTNEFYISELTLGESDEILMVYDILGPFGTSEEAQDALKVISLDIANHGVLEVDEFSSGFESVFSSMEDLEELEDDEN